MSGDNRHHRGMEQSRQKLSELLHGNALPPPPVGRALIFATVAAAIAAIACGMAAYAHDLRIGYLSVIAGALVGMAIIRARGYGKQLAIAASALTLVAIIGASFLKFYLSVFSLCTEQRHGDFDHASTAWQALESPTDGQVEEFAGKWDFTYSTREEFDASYGKALAWFAEAKPTLDEWRQWEFEQRSFGAYLQATNNSTDIVISILALLAAAGVVSLRTSKLEHQKKQQAISERHS